MNPSPSTTVPRLEKNPFLALQHRDFRLLWGGQFISVIGSQMQAVALNWHIWILTRDPVALGLIGLSRLVPVIIFSMIGGVVADSRDRRRVMLVTQTILMLVAAGLGITTGLGRINQYVIYLLSAVAAAAVAFDGPARQALIPNLVPRNHLTNALTLNSIVGQTAQILGPGLAGLVIAGLGVGTVYWINAASFLAVLAALFLIRTPAKPQGLTQGAPRGLHAVREGLSFVLHSRIILSTMLLDFLATFFSSATTLLPIFATNIVHFNGVPNEIAFGILSMSESIGSVVASAVVSLVGDIRRKGMILLLAIGIYGGATALFGFSKIFLLSVLFLALVGAGDTVSTILRQTIRQLVTPDYIRGRMTSVNMIFFMGGPQLGEVESGVAAALLGAPLAVVTGGVATILLVILTAYLVPALRNYHDVS